MNNLWPDKHLHFKNTCLRKSVRENTHMQKLRAIEKALFREPNPINLHLLFFFKPFSEVAILSHISPQNASPILPSHINIPKRNKNPATVKFRTISGTIKAL